MLSTADIGIDEAIMLSTADIGIDEVAICYYC